jgi:hypothetical protein
VGEASVPWLANDRLQPRRTMLTEKHTAVGCKRLLAGQLIELLL